MAKEKIGNREYWEIVYRATSQFIRFSAGAYDKMLMIKSHKLGRRNVSITAESVEILGDKSVFTDNVSLTFPMSNDSELLLWSWTRKDDTPYNISDWVSFITRALRNKKIEKKNNERI